MNNLSGEDWRNIFLGIIAGMTTIITTLGPILIKHWIKKGEISRAQAVATVLEVSVNAQQQTAQALGEMKIVTDATHKIANSRYDEIRRELKASNARVVALLRQIAEGKGQTSAIVAAAIPKKKKRK